MASVTITQNTMHPDIQAARVVAAKTVTAAATTGIGTRFNGQSQESPSAAYPNGRSFISIVVDEASVLAGVS